MRIWKFKFSFTENEMKILIQYLCARMCGPCNSMAYLLGAVYLLYYTNMEKRHFPKQFSKCWTAKAFEHQKIFSFAIRHFLRSAAIFNSLKMKMNKHAFHCFIHVTCNSIISGKMGNLLCRSFLFYYLTITTIFLWVFCLANT